MKNDLKLIYQANSPLLSNLGFKQEHIVLIGGPCSVENEEDLLQYALFLKELGLHYMRAGAFKPRTSPYSFQGLGHDALAMMKRVKEASGIKIISELTDGDDLPLFLEVCDIIQIGARNMQNFTLLRQLGKTNKPLILKRGFGNTVGEWLSAAEYILLAGNKHLILCERGIKTFETSTRNTLDLSSVALVKSIIKLPVIVDPSHATGRSDLIKSCSLASIASGADGLLIEIHLVPEEALSDHQQAVSLDEFKDIYHQIKKIASVFAKTIY